VFQFSGLDSNTNPSWSTNQDLTNPGVMQLTNSPDWSQLVTPSYTDEIKSLRLQAERSLDNKVFNKLTFGVNQTRREKDVNSASFKLTLPTARMAVPADALRGTTHIQIGGIDTSILNWDVPSIMGLYQVTPKDPWRAQGQSYSIREKVSTGFAKLDIDAQLGSVPVHGNVGMQVVHTSQVSDGFAWNDGATEGAPGAGSVIPVTGGASYTDYLPSLNLIFEVVPDLYARFGASRAMARPRMDDMRAGADQPKLTAVALGSSIGMWSAGAGGKPDLQPWRARSFDFSLEKYFGKNSYVSAAVFHKALKSFIYQQSTTRDFSGFPNYSSLTPGCPVSNQSCNPNLGTISAMANGEGGSVYGAELSASLDGALLSPMLRGYGIVGSMSSTKNHLPDDNNGNPINLDGFSGKVNSVTAYYERDGYSARVSRRYRSPFTASSRSILLSTEYSSHIDAEAQVDLQLGYTFEKGALKGLSLQLQAYNVTNQPAVQTKGPEVGGVGTGLLPWKYNTYGRSYQLGASYKF
jgi:iron complex outermembrane receptor protein